MKATSDHNQLVMVFWETEKVVNRKGHNKSHLIRVKKAIRADREEQFESEVEAIMTLLGARQECGEGQPKR